MSYAVNSPQLVHAGVITPTMTLNVAPWSLIQLRAAQENAAGSANLVINDSATLAGANSSNATLTISLATLVTLPQGATIPFGVTTNGLVVSSVPPGVGVLFNW